jgi:hypothetical protein
VDLAGTVVSCDSRDREACVRARCGVAVGCSCWLFLLPKAERTERSTFYVEPNGIGSRNVRRGAPGTARAAAQAAHEAIEVARRAIAPMSAHVARGHRRARTRVPCVMWGTADPLGGCTWPA